jgi:hypothetical protein
VRSSVRAEVRDVSREDLFEAWRRLPERLAARYPLVLVFDDIHWADEGLLDFVDHVADWAQGPIIVVGTARHELFETRPTWGGGKRNAASIYIELRGAVEGFERLSMRLFAARAMVDLGRAMIRTGQDPREVLERARAILFECDAKLFLFEVDEAFAVADA